MPEENLKPSEELIDVGETVGAEINLDEKGAPEKVEEAADAAKEEAAEAEKAEEAVETKPETTTTEKD